MNGKNVLQALDLENYGVLDNQIESVSTIQLYTLVFHRERNLPLKGDAAKVEFMTETLFIGGFKKSRAERTMNLDGSPNDTLG